ncbi:MAG: carbohydrate kinase [Bacteroidetes bacterium]|jgi:fructokinase|nr:carbohydrate kinase [Bacteroidota bacterium]
MVFCLGESLLDIIISSPDDVVVRPGGAMLNAAISIGRCNMKVALISELGDDDSANMILTYLQNNNIDTSFIVCYNNNKTSLALAFLDENKKPKYSFTKNYPEQRTITENIHLTNSDILLFGSVYSLDSQIRKNIRALLDKAKSANTTIIYDPNIRHSHHLEDSKLNEAVYENIGISDIIKGSDEDFTNIFGTSDINEQIKNIRLINTNAFIIITMGSEGVLADYSGNIIRLPAVKTDVLSTIGAGDAFNAGLINGISTLNKLDGQYHSKILQKGLEFSALVCASLDNYIDIKH